VSAGEINGDGDVAAADAGEDAGDEQRPECNGVIFKARPDGKQDIGNAASAVLMSKMGRFPRR
jgi:hypothetical protein